MRNSTVLHLFAVLQWLCILIYSTDGKGGSSSSSASLVEISTEGESYVGRTLKLTCTFPKLVDPRSLFWFKKNDIIYANEDDTVFTSPRIKASADDFKTTKKHELTLPFLLLNDDDVYKCSIEEGEHEVHESTYTLSIIPETNTVMPGQTVSLHCEDNGHILYPRILLWMKANVILVINGTVVHGTNSTKYGLYESDLIIKNVTSADDATYTCYSDGKRIIAYSISIFREPEIVLAVLRGWRGYTFGAALAFIIVGVLVVICYVQNRSPKIVKIKRKVDDW